jgi:hypothetical protein
MAAGRMMSPIPSPWLGGGPPSIGRPSASMARPRQLSSGSTENWPRRKTGSPMPAWTLRSKGATSAVPWPIWTISPSAGWPDRPIVTTSPRRAAARCRARADAMR